MADIKGRYPFSTADGQAIPLDIIRPNSFIQLDIDDTVPTGSQDCPETVEVMAVVATEDCYIQFVGTSSHTSEDTNYLKVVSEAIAATNLVDPEYAEDDAYEKPEWDYDQPEIVK